SRQEDPPLVRWSRKMYRRVLPPFLNHPILVAALMVLLFGGAVFQFTQFKKEYLPEFQENDFLMHWVAKPGTSIDFMREDIKTVSKEMRTDPKTHVKEFGSHIARAEVGEEVVGP